MENWKGCFTFKESDWIACKNCVYFEDCETKEARDGCYFGETEDSDENTAEIMEEEGLL